MENNTKPTVLVVEDDKSLATAIIKKLEVSGIHSLQAASVEEAMDHLEKHETIAAIWLDHYLVGNQDGLDLVSTLKAEDSKFKSLPIFVISNTATQDKVQSYLHLGVAKYFVKANCRLEDIISDVKEAIG